MAWFWYFFFYSFLGFVLEVIYVRIRGKTKRDRKCRLILPVCPVYGLGALSILLLPAGIRENPPLFFLAAALACTGVEYFTGLFYEKIFHVSFWNYSHLPLNLNGRVCLLFSLFWGALALLALRVIHPLAAQLISHIPSWLLIPTITLWAVDTVLTALVLRQTENTATLRWYVRTAHRKTA